jgi:hypothetical protein
MTIERPEPSFSNATPGHADLIRESIDGATDV